LPALAGRLVILADDGVATGATYLASVQALKTAGVGGLVAAIPVGPAETAGLIAQRVDECIILECPEPFYAVGQHYADFHQVDDAEVLHCLATAWQELAH
jgi:putative phosphoribosyl transferase